MNTTVFAQDEAEVDQRMAQIVEEYMNTKDGLVHDRDDLAAAWAERLETTLATTPNEIFHEDDLPTWQSYQQTMHGTVGDLVDAESIEEQRQALAEVSSDLKALIEEFGSGGSDIFVFACEDLDEDMIWLHTSEEVGNPYHGVENTDCGEVIEQL
ncbi:DUF3347 domain-containing protein [Natronogracilivirga saccharolytica]|uniref:DUF3347 domain-containing protein n=1 Tax=Natronogracilivirga saccharolytica TaxID=2812953 RepID=A0A8J7UU96_9BACT|nr:DUF3347 domain-containing protein [Natronogracilivirga saccharolytica]MBP3191267.1 DUF3347 domain-containing protein [Natronogracilivirga saccharolytica]